MSIRHLLLFCTLPALMGTALSEPHNHLRGDIRIMFYNVENYFDTADNPHTNDNEFLPLGVKEWTYKRYRNKTVNIYKTIVAVGEQEPPEIICFAEVENQKVLYDLINSTPLSKYPYSVVHYDSPDQRGIDVGIIYRSDRIRIRQSKAISVKNPANSAWVTRDILYVEGSAGENNSFHLFVNHWPSRLGGVKKSEINRNLAGQTLRKHVNDILENDSCANIIITGDFNDEPFNRSITEILGAVKFTSRGKCSNLYNLSASLAATCKCGTYRYRSEWDMFDQFIVSGAMLVNDKNSLTTCISCIHVAQHHFLLTNDEKYGGKQPSRTYLGPAYKGGFSDHLPVYLDIYFNDVEIK
mgnify:CR=1 FL=1